MQQKATFNKLCIPKEKIWYEFVIWIDLIWTLLIAWSWSQLTPQAQMKHVLSEAACTVCVCVYVCVSVLVFTFCCGRSVLDLFGLLPFCGCSFQFLKSTKPVK